MGAMKVSEAVFACYSRACAPPPVGRGGSTKGAFNVRHGATRAAFRDADAITAKKGGGSVTTKHKGTHWEIRVHNSKSQETYHAKGRSRNSEAALNRLVREYLKQT